MSQNVTFTEAEAVRWEQFKHYKDDLGLTDIQIAEKWHLTTRRQVLRLKKKAKQNGAYTQWMDDKRSWIREEFPELHAEIKQSNLELAYTTIAGMYAKTLPSKTEIKSEHKIEEHVKKETVDVKILAEYKDAIESAVNRDINALRARKQVDSKRSQVAAA